MKPELTEKDILLLKLVFSILIAFLMIRFFVMPGLELYQENSITNEELENKAMEMQDAIDSVPDLQRSVEKQRKELEQLSSPYYPKMENRQVDELLTGLAVQHGLSPISMYIEDAKPEIPMAYLYASRSENTGGQADDASEDVSEADSGGIGRREEALEDADAQLEQEAEVSEGEETGENREYTTSGSYVLASVCTMTLRGEGANVFAFTDALQQNPAIQIRAMHRNERTFMDTDWNVVDMPEVTFTLAVYMYDGTLL